MTRVRCANNNKRPLKIWASLSLRTRWVCRVRAIAACVKKHPLYTVLFCLNSTVAVISKSWLLVLFHPILSGALFFGYVGEVYFQEIVFEKVRTIQEEGEYDSTGKREIED